MKHGKLLLLSIVAPLSAVLFVLFAGHRAPTDTLNAQTPRPVIHSVDPAPPYCLVRDSPHPSDRTITITGENFGSYGNNTLRFSVRGSSRARSLYLSSQIDWISSTQIKVDLGRIKQFLPDEPWLVLTVQVNTDHPYRPLSNWSPDFILTDNPKACGASLPTPTPAPSPTPTPTPSPTPTPTPSPTPFPPTSPVRGVTGDLWADVVIGQVDFSETSPDRVVPFKVFNPGGVVVDRSVDPGRAYIWDSGNSRILGIDLARCYEGAGPCSAEIVMGQPSLYDHSACNGDSGVQGYPVRASAGPDTLCGIYDHYVSPVEGHTFVTMAVDSRGSLYVPDSLNHRVLKYVSPFESDQIADEVWGQTDFTGMMCNQGALEGPTAETLCFYSYTNRFVTKLYGNGVEIGSHGSLWVADGGNNRVLRFPLDSATGKVAKRADLVLGQSDFHSAAPGSALDRLHAPSAVRVDHDGTVYVADTVNDRILVFEPPLESGMPADRTFASRLYRPTSLKIDPAVQGIWVLDAGNYMVELWDTTGASVVQVLGKDSYQPNRECGHPLTELPGAPHMCPIAGSLGIDGHGNVLVPAYLDTADVFRFPAPATQDNGGVGSHADRRLFFPPGGTNYRDEVGLRSPRGVVVWNDQLIVSDIHRLMYWNGLDELTDGQPANGEIGERFSSRRWAHCCGRIKADASGIRCGQRKQRFLYSERTT